ncbi:MAG: DUF1353 domain-containing protein [Phenylobacterium sp.]|nr:DUF1353 domain-containing protein [Phenylobacterium sp.]
MTARITGAFRVEEVPGLVQSGRPCVRLLEALEYRVGHAESPETIVVPAGFVTDFASVPWGLWNLFPPLGAWARPAIIHDFLYATGGDGWWQPPGSNRRKWITGPIREDWTAPVYTREEADKVFREALAIPELGIPAWRRAVMYRAVRLGGASGWADR